MHAYLTRLNLVVHHDLLLDEPLPVRVLQYSLVCHRHLTNQDDVIIPLDPLSRSSKIYRFAIVTFSAQNTTSAPTFFSVSSNNLSEQQQQKNYLTYALANFLSY
jgi:hypothetical protein